MCIEIILTAVACMLLYNSEFIFDYLSKIFGKSRIVVETDVDDEKEYVPSGDNEIFYETIEDIKGKNPKELEQFFNGLERDLYKCNRLNRDNYGECPIQFLMNRNSRLTNYGTTNSTSRNFTPMQNLVVIAMFTDSHRLNKKDTSGETLLHKIFRQDITYNTPEGHTFLKILIQYGANINIRNYDGKSPFDLAVSKNLHEMCQLMDPTWTVNNSVQS
jgi:hypothetical protein